jgi:hypothetical protein
MPHVLAPATWYHQRCSTMESNAIAQLKELLASAGELRDTLSNGERLQLLGLADALRSELERPDETIYRITFNEVRFT